MTAKSQPGNAISNLLCGRSGDRAGDLLAGDLLAGDLLTGDLLAGDLDLDLPR